jgi:hypothetical protein
MKCTFPFAALRFAIALLCSTAFFSIATAAADLADNTAAGSFLPKGGVPVALTSAAAFVDEKDTRKPVILILSDKKLPAEKWTSEFDLMRAHPDFSGVLFWIDQDGKVFRTDIYVAGRQSSVSGYFELKLNGPIGKDLTGTAKASEPVGDGPRLDVTFHAKLR